MCFNILITAESEMRAWMQTGRASAFAVGTQSAHKCALVRHGVCVVQTIAAVACESSM